MLIIQSQFRVYKYFFIFHVRSTGAHLYFDDGLFLEYSIFFLSVIR